MGPWLLLQPLSLRMARRGQRSSPVTKVIGTTSCPGIGVNLKVSTTESGGSSRECILCPTLVMVPPRTPGTCFLQAQKSCGSQRQGVGSSYDAEQEILCRNCPWSIYQESQDPCGACPAIVYSCDQC